MFNNILMPTDGSEHSEKAVERGITLAKLCGARVTGLHVLPDYRMSAALAESAYEVEYAFEKVEADNQARATRFLSFVRQAAAVAGIPCKTVVATNDHPFDAIVNSANEHHCDLIVMTSRYRPGLASLMLRSESERVLHRSSIPVLTFRALMSADHPDASPEDNWGNWLNVLRKRATPDNPATRP